MRHQQIRFIFEALKFFYSKLQFSCFWFLSYCCIDVCVRKLQLHAAWWLMIEFWATLESWFLAVFEIVLLLRTLISQCVISEISSFLQRWTRLNESYNSVVFNFYHIVKLMRVLENFNCILFDDWTLMLDIRLWLLI